MKKLMTFLLLAAFWAGCKKEDDKPVKPVATNVEIGLRNEKTGYIGQDFHLNADIKAVTKIDEVSIEIRQRDGVWVFKQTWNEYKGLRNTNVHKHFYIPTDAPAGAAAFLLRVSDANGSLLEMQTPFTIREK